MSLPYSYTYEGKIAKCIGQFLRIFTGIQVQYGVDRDSSGTNDFRTVTVHYGSIDRVVAEVLNNHGSFTAQKLPLLSGFLTGIELNADRRKSRKHKENIRYIRESDSAKITSSKVMGTPYIATMDLSILASNNKQMMQILEQILLIFNPRLTIQTSEDVHDWSYISQVELISIANEENFPSGIDNRTVVQTLSFNIDFWLNYPRIEETSIIEEIQINIKDNTNNIVGLDEITIP